MVVQSLPVRSWKLVWMIHFEQLFWGYSHHLGCGFTWSGWENGSLYPSSTRQFKWKSITLEQETVIGISLGRTRFKNTAGKRTRQDPRNGEWWEMEEILWAVSKVTLGFKPQMFAAPEEKLSQTSSNETKTAARQERSSAHVLTRWGRRICSQKGLGVLCHCLGRVEKKGRTQVWH